MSRRVCMPEKWWHDYLCHALTETDIYVLQNSFSKFLFNIFEKILWIIFQSQDRKSGTILTLNGAVSLFSMIWCKINFFFFQRIFFQSQLIDSSFNVIRCIHMSFIKEYRIEFSLSLFWNIVWLIEKYTTCILRWNDMKTVFYTSFQRGTLVVYMYCYC